MKYTLLAVSIIIIILLVGGMFLWQNPTPQSTPPTSVTPSPSPATSTPSQFYPNLKIFDKNQDDCKNEDCEKIRKDFIVFLNAPLADRKGWLNYHSDNFSFQYPKDWKIQEQKVDNETHLSFLSKATSDSYKNTSGNVTDASYDFTLIIKKNVNFSDFFKKLDQEFPTVFGPYQAKFPNRSNFMVRHSIGLGLGTLDILVPNQSHIYYFKIGIPVESPLNSNIKTIINLLKLS